MNSAIPIVFALASVSLAMLGLLESIKELTISYRTKLVSKLCY